METKRKAKGSWGLRFFIVVLGVVLGMLFFWLLSFVERDIGTMPGPDREAIRREYVSEELDLRLESLKNEAGDLRRRIQALQEQQSLLRDSTGQLQNTINQLLAIQKQAAEQRQTFPRESAQTLAKSQSAFLENQEAFQAAIQQIAELMKQQRDKEAALATVVESIEANEALANAMYDRLNEKYELKVAVLKLAFLVPVFLAVSYFFMKYRATVWWPLVWAAFIASFIKIAEVSHEYFPEEYFKYIGLAVVIAIVVRLLVYLIRLIAAPKKELLLKQYQQHYDKCICPVCSKPIRTGPLRYLGALHKKAPLPGGKADAAAGPEPYTCPSCGTELYNKCGQCGQIRHTLLPYCEHCGAKKDA